MGHFTASDITSKEAVAAVHAGVNARVASYTLTETASGSTSIAICRLPAGARVVGGILTADVDGIGTGAEEISVTDNLGNTHMVSTTFATVMRFGSTAFATRLTSSAHLNVNIHAAVGTGTTSMAFTIVPLYLADKAGD